MGLSRGCLVSWWPFLVWWGWFGSVFFGWVDGDVHLGWFAGLLGMADAVRQIVDEGRLVGNLIMDVEGFVGRDGDGVGGAVGHGGGSGLVEGGGWATV